MTGVPTVWVTSLSLVAYYIEHGVKPYDVELASDGSGTLLFLFSKNATQHLFVEWRTKNVKIDNEQSREIGARAKAARQHQEDVAWGKTND